MLKVSGKVWLGSHAGFNLVLDSGKERFLQGERIWDMLKWLWYGVGKQESKAFHTQLQSPLGKVPVEDKTERFDLEQNCFIIECKAKVPGPLQEIAEFGWGDESGLWNRITTDKLEGVPGTICLDEDEILEVVLQIVFELGEPQEAQVIWDGVPRSGQVLPVGKGNKLAWSGQGLGANKGLGVWGTGIGIEFEGQGKPRDAFKQGNLTEYQVGSKVRFLEVILNPDEACGKIVGIYFGTSMEGSKNLEWLWKLALPEGLEKTAQSKLKLKFGWSLN